MQIAGHAGSIHYRGKIQLKQMHNLDKEIRRAEPLDLAAKIGALQLLPENAHHFGRLEVAGSAAASLRSPAHLRTPIGPSKLRRWLHGPILGQGFIAAREGPYTVPFTEDVPFFGGSYTVFPGLLEDASFIVRHINEAVFSPALPTLPQDVTDLIYRITRTALTISHAIAQRCDYRRNIPAVPYSDTVLIPDNHKLSSLQSAVQFSTGDLVTLLAPLPLSDFVLAEVSLTQGEVPIGEINPIEPPTAAKPFLRTSDGLIAVAPQNILSALRHIVLRYLSESSLLDEFAWRFRFVVFRTIVDSLSLMNTEPIPVSISDSNTDRIHQHFFRIDSDKVLNLMLVTDDFHGFDTSVLWGRWDAQTLIPSVEQMMRDAELTAFTRLTPCPNEVFHLVIFQGCGRSFVFGTDGGSGPVYSRHLFFSASALWTIALIENGDPLFLWNYADAHDRIRNTTRLLTMDPLDESAVYRSKSCSYYLTDGEPPQLVTVVPGEGGHLHQQAADEVDLHIVTDFDSDGYVEVVLKEGDAKIPIYWLFPRAGCPKRLALMVEGLALPIWIVDPEGIGGTPYWGLYRVLIDLVAYWLWQSSDVLRPAVESLARSGAKRIRVDVEAIAENGWFSQAESERSNILNCRRMSSEHIMLTIGSGISGLLEAPDNQAERSILRVLLTEMLVLVDRPPAANLSEAPIPDIDAVVDQIAPLGRKKKCLFCGSDVNPALIKDGLPYFRPVQPAVEQEVLDEIGEIAKTDVKFQQGDVSPERRGALLNGIVHSLFRRFEMSIRQLSSVGLLEWLVSHHERIVYEEAFTNMTIPTRIACYGSLDEMLSRLRTELPERTQAAIAARIVIEYVTACPPSGLRPISLSVYDRLLALASQIHQIGLMSDSIRCGLSNRTLALLPSGRVAFGASEYETGLTQYFEEYTFGSIGRSEEFFDNHWRSGRSPAESASRPFDALLEAATADEFGLPFRELVQFLVEVYFFGFDRANEPKCESLDSFVKSVQSRLSWPLEKTERAFQFFSAQQRSDFFQPPSPHTKADVYPWRFNRSLSYFRKPLLVRRTDNREEVVWGIRHLHQCVQYLTDLCSGGRLRAKTPSMTKFLSAYRERRSKDFNDLVANVFEKRSHLDVRRRVSKIGKRRISRDSGELLGDIDVFVSDANAKTILAVETKRLIGARTPSEIASELVELFGSSDAGPGKLTIHAERVAWLNDHLQEVLTWLKLPLVQTDRWQVRGIAVVNKEIPSAFLAKSPISVLTLRRLVQQMDDNADLALIGSPPHFSSDVIRQD